MLGSNKIWLVFLVNSLLLTSPLFGQSSGKNVSVKKDGFEEFIKDPFEKNKDWKTQGAAADTTQLLSHRNSRITFRYTEYDFGVVPQQSKITHYFKVWNSGTDTLVISQIQPT